MLDVHNVIDSVNVLKTIGPHVARIHGYAPKRVGILESIDENILEVHVVVLEVSLLGAHHKRHHRLNQDTFALQQTHVDGRFLERRSRIIQNELSMTLVDKRRLLRDEMRHHGTQIS